MTAELQRGSISVEAMLPVTSGASPEVRHAATPKHAVSVRAVTSKSVVENWLTIALHHQLRIIRKHGAPSRKIHTG